MDTINLKKEYLNISNVGHGLIYNKETEKFDVSLNMTTDHLIKVTYDELVDLRDTSSLEPGVFYRITDYEFTSTDPEVINAGHRFDIIVLALSEDTLSEDARAIQHEFTEEEKKIYSEEEQHYFDNSNLAAWKLKYSLDGNSKRFAWAPTNKLYGINIISSAGNQTLYRNTSKDEEIYYAFSDDNHTYYTTSEEPVEGDSLYEKKDGLIKLVFRYDIWYNAKQILIKSDYSENYYLAYLDENDNYVMHSSDNYTIDRYNYDELNIIRYNDWEYIVVDETYSYIDEDGTTKTGILITQKYYSTNWLHKGNDFNVNFPWTFTDYVRSGEKGNPFSESYTFTLTKLPEIGDTIEVILGDDSYVPYTSVSLSDRNINQQITYVRDCTKVLGTIPKNTTYRGIIYGMIDEYENDCEYDFKNIMFTGLGTLFDPNLFYYTFVNTDLYTILPAKYLNVRDLDTPIKLLPGLYTKLDNTHFKYLPERSSLQAYKLDGYKDTYAYVINNSATDEDTGELYYPVEIYQYNLYSKTYIRLWEDKIFYIKLDIYNTTITEVPILYCKDSLNNISEYRIYSESPNGISTWLKSADKAWIWYGPLWGESECDFYTINLNHSNSSFDISDLYDTYTSGLLNCTTQYDWYEYCKYGATSSSVDNYAVMSYVTEGSYGEFTCYIDLNLSVGGGKVPEGFLVNTEKKFSKPMKLDQSMYLYWFIDNVNKLKRIVYSEKSVLSLGDPVYDYDFDNLCFVLYATFQNSVHDATVSNSPDCYRVKVRNKDSLSARHYLNPTICKNVTNSTISSSGSEFKDCYCINGHFLDSVIQLTYFALLDTVIYSTISDCYMLYGTRITDSSIEKVRSANMQHIDLSTLYAIGDSMFSVVDHSTIINCFSGLFLDVGNSSFIGGTNITLINVHNSDFYNHNSYGDYYSNTVRNLVSIGLHYKSIDISEFIDNSTTKRIISEDDLTITV